MDQDELRAMQTEGLAEYYEARHPDAEWKRPPDGQAVSAEKEPRSAFFLFPRPAPWPTLTFSSHHRTNSA